MNYHFLLTCALSAEFFTTAEHNSQELKRFDSLLTPKGPMALRPLTVLALIESCPCTPCHSLVPVKTNRCGVCEREQQPVSEAVFSIPLPRSRVLSPTVTVATVAKTRHITSRTLTPQPDFVMKTTNNPVRATNAHSIAMSIAP